MSAYELLRWDDEGDRSTVASADDRGAEQHSSSVNDEAPTGEGGIVSSIDIWKPDTEQANIGLLSSTTKEIETTHPDSEDVSRNTSRTIASRISACLADTWVPEMIALGISFGSFIGLVVLFAVWNGSNTSTWKARLSFPTTVAILSRASQATLAVSVSSCLGQMGWLHYRRRNAVAHFQCFDAAARGPLGVIRLLIAVPTGLAFLSAFLAITGLGYEAAAQQCLNIQGPEIIPRATALQEFGSRRGVNPNQVFEALKDAATRPLMSLSRVVTGQQESLLGGSYDGSTSLPQSLDYTCAGDCTPPPYATLDLCSRCEDVTNELAQRDSQTYCLSDTTSCIGSSSVISMSAFPVTNANTTAVDPLSVAYFDAIEHIHHASLEAVPLERLTEAWLVAQRCSLFICLNTYQLDASAGGTPMTGVKEQLLNTITQSSRTDDKWSFVVRKDVETDFADRESTYWSVDKSIYTIDRYSVEFLQESLITLFNGSDLWQARKLDSGGTGFGQYRAPVDVPYALANMIFGRQFEKPVVAANGSAVTDNAGTKDASLKEAVSRIVEVFSAITTSMGGYLRDYAYTRGSGRSLENALYRGVRDNTYQMRWAWIAIPATVEALACLLLMVVILKTRKSKVPVWKTNAMAIMFRGASLPEFATHPGSVDCASNMEALADRTYAELQQFSTGYRLFA